MYYVHYLSVMSVILIFRVHINISHLSRVIDASHDHFKQMNFPASYKQWVEIFTVNKLQLAIILIYTEIYI